MLDITIDGIAQSQVSSSSAPLSSELEFYNGYAWCLDPHLKVQDAKRRLADEIDKLALDLCDWQINEVATNIFLLAGALLNCVEEYLRGPGLKMPARLVGSRVGRFAGRTTDYTAGLAQPQRFRVRRWRNLLLTGLDEYLPCLAQRDLPRSDTLRRSAACLGSLSRSPLPPALEAQVIGVPSPFRRLDLTHLDVLGLGEQLIKRFPDRSRAMLLLGLRTSGSYFAPLLRCFLRNQGYRSVALITMQPNNGPGRHEYRELRHYAQQGYTAVVLDDPPDSGSTVMQAIEIACNAGFTPGNVIALVPAHPARRNCFGPLADSLVVSLPPEQWYKYQLMEPELVQERLVGYYHDQDFQFVQVVKSQQAKEFESRLQSHVLDDRGARLKRVFEVKLRNAGCEETRFVLAKSVGWGWLGYHAFLAGHRLSGLVPNVLGLRNGILYTEWLPWSSTGADRDTDRGALLDASADYVAARTRLLRLDGPGSPGRYLFRHENAIRLLAKVCAKAYGAFPMNQLMRPLVEQRLAGLPCPHPTLIDGKMEPDEWIAGPDGLLKADFEHHGMGKSELNFTDPAFDLAQTVLELEAGRAEEKDFIRRYIEASGDTGVESRMFMNKMLAGVWTMDSVRQQLFGKSHGAEKQQFLHRRYVRAWNFLTIHAARACGGLFPPVPQTGWRSPLVALDIDGVIDRRVFGFPCTTAAGIRALSLLRTHGFTVVLNTARTAMEVREYCEAYSLTGGVAEHGSYLWDAVDQEARVLLSAEELEQLDELRRRLRQTPGVFLDERHRYSIRAFTYHKVPHGLAAFVSTALRPTGAATAPLSPLLMNDLINALGLDRLSFHQTTIDTTVVAKDVDKGTGLTALREWVLDGEASTFAIGDSESDLQMFRAATRAFAPAQISCAREAKLLGCRIAHQPYQRGLLEIAHILVHPDGQRCERCADIEFGRHEPWLMFLQAADRSAGANFVRDALHRRTFRALLR